MGIRPREDTVVLTDTHSTYSKIIKLLLNHTMSTPSASPDASNTMKPEQAQTYSTIKTNKDGEEEVVLTDALKDVNERTKAEKIVQVSSIASMVMGIASLICSFIFGQTAVQTVANIGAIFTPPIAVKNETELTNRASMVEVHERMVRENERMKAENKRLRDILNGLDGTTNKFEDGLDTLVFITKKQDFNVEQFEQQVNEQKALLKTMEEQKTAKIMQMFLSIVIKGDRDGDFNIDINELDDLIQQLEVVPGMVVNQKLFREVVGKNDGSLVAVLDVVRNLNSQDENTLDEEKVMYLEEHAFGA